MYIQGDALTNKSLRERFNVSETSAGSISRLIKEAISQGKIKALDPDTAKRYMRYIPIWAYFNLPVICWNLPKRIKNGNVFR